MNANNDNGGTLLDCPEDDLRLESSSTNTEERQLKN